MEFSYTSADYNGFLLALLGSVLLLSLIVGLLGPRFAVRRGRSAGSSLLFSCICITGFLLLGCWAVPFLEWTGCLAIPGENDTWEAAGRVEAVEIVENAPPYWIDSRRCGAVILTIGEERYYVIDQDALEPGMHIAFTYAPEGNVIVRWKAVNREEAERIGHMPPPPEEPAPAREVPPWLQKLSLVLYIIGIGGFMLMVLGQQFFYLKIQTAILERDARHRDGVIPGYVGLLEVLFALLLFAFMIFGNCITHGNYSGCLILVLGGGVMVFMTLLDSQTRVCIRGRKLVISRFGKEQSRDLDEISAVRWEKSRGAVGWMLVIRFFRGDHLELKVENHLGLTELHKRLNKHLEIRRNSEKA